MKCESGLSWVAASFVYLSGNKVFVELNYLQTTEALIKEL